MPERSLKTHTDLLVAGTALFVSLSTLGVYIYQAKVMKEQQHVSVWPYVEWLTTNIDGYYYAAKNKGVGPALIKKVEMRLDGRVLADNPALCEAVMGKNWKARIHNSTLEGRVLSPGEEIKPFHVVGGAEAKDFEEKIRGHRFEMDIIYASVYGETWKCTGTEVVRLSTRQPSLY